MEIEKEKYEAIMQKYGQLTGTGLEKKVTEAFGKAVTKSITDSQRFADAVVNSISARKVTRKVDESTTEIVDVPADYGQAKEALEGLAKSVGPVVEHWRSFIELASEALEVDVRGLVPSQMVPDMKLVEKEFRALDAERRSLEKQLDQATKNMETALEMQSKAEAAHAATRADVEAVYAMLEAEAATSEVAASIRQQPLKTLFSVAARNIGDLTAENAALKGKLENAMKADTGQKPSSDEKKHDSKPKSHR